MASVYNASGWLIASLIAVALLSLCIIPIISIKYVIEGTTLKIYSLWFFHQDIDIMSIRKIEPSRSILSSPAGSLKRLAIHFGKYDTILISPRNQQVFLEQIKRINNKIIIN